MAIPVVLVDDDALFRESLSRNLAGAGFAVTDFDNGPAALGHIREGARTELVILDWRMPAMSGIEVLKRLRDIRNDIPALFLTVLTDQIHEEAALATGAVDFVDKSRSFNIVLKRLQLILSGAKSGLRADQAAPVPETEREDLTVGDLVLRMDVSRVTWRERPVDLTLTEVRMVHHLARNAGRDISYRALYDVVHGEGFIAGAGSDGYRANVRTFVKRIRHKFRDVDDAFDHIENYAGFGYRWRRHAGD
ncbi:MAG: response regulator transcription factor [Alphaproteobacteria bacterium]